MKKRKGLVVPIEGGLGNQLFMLTAGIYLSEKYNRQIYFDITDLERIGDLHPGENVYTLGLLSNFECLENSSRQRSNLLPLLAKLKEKIPNHFLRSLFLKNTYRVSEIGYFDFDFLPPDIRKVTGYFQTWRYLSEIKDKPNLTVQNSKNFSNWYRYHEKRIQNEPIAAIHIRRGDYYLPKNQINGILALKYYESIIECIPPQLQIWVFTDDPASVSEELGKSKISDRKIYVLNPAIDSDPIESMLLMSQASLIGIANSTFSWWAAALAKPGTDIYAPSKWFEFRTDPLDLIPEVWKKVQSEWVLR